MAERLIIQFVIAQVQCFQVQQTREIFRSDDSDVVLFKDKSHGIIYDGVHVVEVFNMTCKDIRDCIRLTGHVMLTWVLEL